MSRAGIWRTLLLVGAVAALEALCLAGVIDRITMQPPHKIVLDLWKDTVTAAGTTGWAYQGNFTLDLSGANPSLIWDAASAVPEPATYGLCAGAGLLVLSLRNQFRRKIA